MSFPNFRFKEVVNQDWEDSDFYNTLANSTFMFIVFEKINDSDSNSIFKGIKFWSMPDEDIDIVELYWNDFIKVLKEGVVLTVVNGEVKNNFPKKVTNTITHVRSHAQKRAYKINGFEEGNLVHADELPDGRFMTKQCFWLNKEYISEAISGITNSENTRRL